MNSELSSLQKVLKKCAQRVALGQAGAFGLQHHGTYCIADSKHEVGAGRAECIDIIYPLEEGRESSLQWRSTSQNAALFVDQFELAPISRFPLSWKIRRSSQDKPSRRNQERSHCFGSPDPPSTSSPHLWTCLVALIHTMAASVAMRPCCAFAPPTSLASTPLAGSSSAVAPFLPSHARLSLPSHARRLAPPPSLRFCPARCEATAATAPEKQARVDVLSEALPFIQRFQGKTVVVKYGGAAMKDGSLKEGVIKDVVLLACVGLRPVLVHGGGPEINGWLQKLGIEPVFKQGLRVTDGPTMEVVEMVLTGKVNKSLVALINQAGGSAVGLCGKDARLITARPEGRGEWGFVGEVKKVDVSILQTLVRDGHIPVIASVAADDLGQSYNINADTAAGEIAASLGAEKLILMTDVPGLMMDFKDPSTIIREVSIKGVKQLIADGVVSGGMIPKVDCCVRSLAQGVKATHIIDGRLPHSLLLEILTDEGRGTMITG